MPARACRSVAETAALYDRIAESYQQWWAPVIEPATLGLLDLVDPIVAATPEARIVDVGAGTGPLARAAVARWPGVRVTAVDPSAGMLQLGRAEADRTLDRSAHRRIRWLQGQGEELPIADGRADVVVSSFVLQHLVDRGAALRETRRVLRPGGLIAMVTWLENDTTFAPYMILSELADDLAIERPPSSATAFKSPASVAAVFRRAGFRAVRSSATEITYQWTLEGLAHSTLDVNAREALDSLEEDVRAELIRRWQERIEPLTPDDLCYRDMVVQVTGRSA